MNATHRPLRVIQWSTGNAGKNALRGILSHPDLELVGIHAHSADKIGKDAAELCDWPEATGIIATDDADALLASGADCVCYTAQGETRMREVIDEIREEHERLPAPETFETAMRVVNAIPVVCDSDPGVLSILDLPMFTAKTS